MERKNLLNRRFDHFVCPENKDQWAHHFLDVLQRDGRQGCELALQRFDGFRFYGLITSLRSGDSLSSSEPGGPLFDENTLNIAPFLRLVIIDTTNIKQAKATPG